jgi:RimJ/RimL family protein N-acetyltransferase
MIGEAALHGRGLGTAAGRLVCRIAFEQMGILRLYLSVTPTNTAAIRSYNKLGFLEDHSPEARRYADDPGDVTMSLDAGKFTQGRPVGSSSPTNT